MTYIPDAYDRWEQHEAEQEKELEKLPVCDACGCPIQDEHCFKIGHELFCEECMNENFRVRTETLVD